jgi:hypothetical protein
MSRTRLAVGIPWQQEMVWTDFLFNFWETDIPRDARLIRGDRMDVPQSRNTIVRKALEWGATELIFMDVDQSFPQDVLARLRSHKKDIVSGWAALRKQPHFPLAYMKDGDGYRPTLPQGSLQKVDGFGFGCVLIQMPVFVKMGGPWFEQIFWPADHEKAGGLKVGHDLNWCRNAQEAGYDLWVDNTVQCGHLMNVMIDHDYAMKNYEHMMTEHVLKERIQKAQESRIVGPDGRTAVAR